MTDFVSITIVVVIIFMVFRWLSASGDNQPRRQAQNRGRMTTRPTRLVNPEMVETVRSMFPHVPTAAIHYDLQKTGSVEQTCDNILRDGSLPMPPAPRPPTPLTTVASSSSSSVATGSNSINGNLVQRFKLQEAAEKNFVPEEPTKVWGDSAEKRQEVFKSRKEFMVLQARKRLLEKEAQKAAAGAAGAETEVTPSVQS
ncbi:hypothetical protein BGZ94_001616 [Podila epigama]|nr:hypothetical protein BGZ94_001616 [Podila epigama]